MEHKQMKRNTVGLLRNLYTAWQLFWDPEVPIMLKFLLPFMAIVYWVFPFDFLPFLPFDDIVVMLAAMSLFVNLAKRNTMPDDSRSYEQASNAQVNNHLESSDDHEAPTISTTWSVIEE